MTPKEFQQQFKRLLLSKVDGMAWDDKIARVRQYMRQLEARQSPEEESAELSPSVEIIPFEPGKRPVDEALYPGHGCSEQVGLLSVLGPDGAGADSGDEVWILYRLQDLYAFVAPFDRKLEVTLSAWFLPPVAGQGEPCPVPGLTDVPLRPEVVSTAAYPVPLLEPSSWDSFHQTAYVASITPRQALLPRSGADGGGYRWDELPPHFRAQAGAEAEVPDRGPARRVPPVVAGADHRHGQGAALPAGDPAGPGAAPAQPA